MRSKVVVAEEIAKADSVRKLCVCVCVCVRHIYAGQVHGIIVTHKLSNSFKNIVVFAVLSNVNSMEMIVFPASDACTRF